MPDSGDDDADATINAIQAFSEMMRGVPAERKADAITFAIMQLRDDFLNWLPPADAERARRLMFNERLSSPAVPSELG